jgi:hypothetical protein
VRLLLPPPLPRLLGVRGLGLRTLLTGHPSSPMYEVYQ